MTKLTFYNIKVIQVIEMHSKIESVTYFNYLSRFIEQEHKKYNAKIAWINNFERIVLQSEHDPWSGILVSQQELENKIQVLSQMVRKIEKNRQVIVLDFNLK